MEQELKTKKLFRTSMYFFVPLKNGNKRIRWFEDNPKKIEIPDYINRMNDELYYVQLYEDRIYGEFEGQEHRLIFKATSGEYEIDLNMYQLQYCPNKNKSEAVYFLVIGTDIDETLQLSENDLIELKKAFFQKRAIIQPNGREHWMLTSKVSGKPFYEFLKNKLEKVDEEVWDNPTLTYALVDVRGVSIGYGESFSFDKKYYLDDLQHIEEVLGKSYTTFAYGLLHTHDYYEALDSDEIKKSMTHPVTDLKSERFYSIHGNMVFLRTHYPFKDNIQAYNKKRLSPFNFGTLPNIYEMCKTIITEQNLNKYEPYPEDKNENRNLRKSISEILTEMTKKYFNVKNLDDKMKYIYESWGFYELQDAIIKMNDQDATAIDEKRNYLYSIWGCFIAFMSLIVTICSVYIAWHHPGIPNDGGNCTCICEKPVEHTLQLALSTGENIQTVIMLLIIVLCVIAIISMIAVWYTQIVKRDRN